MPIFIKQMFKIILMLNIIKNADINSIPLQITDTNTTNPTKTAPDIESISIQNVQIDPFNPIDVETYSDYFIDQNLILWIKEYKNEFVEFINGNAYHKLLYEALVRNYDEIMEMENIACLKNFKIIWKNPTEENIKSLHLSKVVDSDQLLIYRGDVLSYEEKIATRYYKLLGTRHSNIDFFKRRICSVFKWNRN